MLPILDHEDILKDIGFSVKEARVYLSLLALGKANAYQVALKSGLKKPTAYVILEELQKKGFVSLIPREKKKQYLPVSPELLIANYKEKVSLAEKALPGLLAIRRDIADKPIFTIHEGKNACLNISKKLYRDHKGQNIFGMYAKAEDLTKDDLDYYKELATEVAKNSIQAKIIMPDTLQSNELILKIYTNKYFTARLLPEGTYSTVNAIEIFEDVVSIETVGKYQIALIESTDYADTMKQIFDFLYNSSQATLYEHGVHE